MDLVAWASVAASAVVVVGGFFRIIIAIVRKVTEEQNRQIDAKLAVRTGQLTQELSDITEALSVELDQKLEPIKRDLATVKGEVTTNSGRSLKDAVNRLEKRVDGVQMIRQSEP